MPSHDDYLDPEQYRDYVKESRETYEGAEIIWRNMPVADRPKYVPVIEAHADLWRSRYLVSLEMNEDQSYIHMTARFRGRPTGAMVLSLTGGVAALKIATRWGGP